MATELILFSALAVESIFIVLFNRLRAEFLIGTIAVNLILISVFGGLLITVFGFTTNIGNVFYVAVSLALYLLLEHYGYKTAERAVWVSFALVLLFIILSQMAISVSGIPAAREIENSLHKIFAISPRLALASLLAFLLSQYINLYVYERLRQALKGRLLWLRSNVSNIATQMIDSAIFFLVAFAITTPLSQVWTIMITGFTLKIAFGFLTTPFLYLSYLSERQAVNRK